MNILYQVIYQQYYHILINILFLMIKAIHYIRQADVLLIGGTSLVVYPAAGLVTYYRGHKLAVINKGGAGGGLGAAVTVDGPIGQVLAQL